MYEFEKKTKATGKGLCGQQEILGRSRFLPGAKSIGGGGKGPLGQKRGLKHGGMAKIGGDTVLHGERGGGNGIEQKIQRSWEATQKKQKKKCCRT